MIFNIQSESFLSIEHCFATLKFAYDIISRSLIFKHGEQLISDLVAGQWANKKLFAVSVYSLSRCSAIFNLSSNSETFESFYRMRKK